MAKGSGGTRGAAGGAGKLQSALRSKENAIRNSDVEHSFVFDDKGNIVFSAVGDHNSVVTSATTDNITLHNHPGGGSFSKKDVESVLYGNEKEMIVVGGNYTYSLKRPAGGWKKGHMAAYNKALKTVNAKDASYQDNYKGDYWTTFRRTNRTHEHRVMKEFAKAMGYEYTKKKTK